MGGSVAWVSRMGQSHGSVHGSVHGAKRKKNNNQQQQKKRTKDFFCIFLFSFFSSLTSFELKNVALVNLEDDDVVDHHQQILEESISMRRP